MRLFVRADSIWIVVDGGHAASVAGALARYAIMDDFAAAPEPDFAVISLLGPKAADHLRALGIDAGALAEAPPLAHTEAPFEGGTLWLVRVRELGALGFWLGGPRAVVETARARLAAAGIAELDPAAAEAARIAAMEPRFGAEITADYFPMEVGLAGAVDYQKGCYLGQEPIVRIRDRGHINWRLVGLDLVDGAGPVDPTAGDALEADTKPKAGRVTSAARLPDGRGVALAVLHMSIPVGAEIRIRHGEAAIVARVRAEASVRGLTRTGDRSRTVYTTRLDGAGAETRSWRPFEPTFGCPAQENAHDSVAYAQRVFLPRFVLLCGGSGRIRLRQQLRRRR